jgi:hypothetical protein
VKHIAVGIIIRHISAMERNLTVNGSWLVKNALVQVPPWVREESLDRLAGDSPDWTDRGTADGNSVQPDSDFGEFLLNHQLDFWFKVCHLLYFGQESRKIVICLQSH